MLAVDGRVENTYTLKEIISLAKQKLLEFDSVLLDLQAEGKKLEGLAKDMADIFGADSENVLQVKEKFNAVAKKIRERVEFLTKSV